MIFIALVKWYVWQKNSQMGNKLSLIYTMSPEEKLKLEYIFSRKSVYISLVFFVIFLVITIVLIISSVSTTASTVLGILTFIAFSAAVISGMNALDNYIIGREIPETQKIT